LVHLRNNPLFEITIPSKIQAYLAVGKPILIGVKGDAADLVKTASAGLCCNPEDSADIARNVVKLYQLPREELVRMGENGRRFYLRELSLDVGVKRFASVFRSLVDLDGISQTKGYMQ
jgi:glycosyltransferase involved in cell wall biosynthesis